MNRLVAFAAGFVSCMLLVAAIGWLAAVRAEDWAVATCCAHHFQRKHYNERNWGIGIEHTISDRWRLFAGEYDNSLYRQTIYAGAAYTPWSAGNWRFGSVMGIFTGYTDYPVPMAAPVVMYEGERFGVNVIVVPIPQGLVAAQLKWRFN